MNRSHRLPARRRLLRVGLVGLVGVVSGCASRSPSSSASPTGPGWANGTTRGAPPDADVEPPLQIEQRWLEDWFRGTPVVVRPDGDTKLTVEVPLRYCFDAGRSEVKAPLQAVVDRVAQSLRRRGQARVQLATPADDPPSSKADLAQARAAKVGALLQARGVSAARISGTAKAPADAVVLQLVWPEPRG